jgi:rhodanese-related sulfurtransferase
MKQVKSSFKTGWILSFLVFLIIGFVVYFLYNYAVNSPFRISSEKAKQMILNNEFPLILDVRTDLERKTLGYFPDSVHIEKKNLANDMPRYYPNKNIKILVYCNTGHRARMATEQLHEMGYKNAVYISSGYKSLQMNSSGKEGLIL